MPTVTPIAAQTASTGVPSPSQTAARERAISILNGAAAKPGAQQAQEMPVQNPNKISPEEMTGTISQASAPDTSGQSNTSEASKAEVPAEPAKADADPLSSQYATLARKEKALRAKVTAQEAAITAREAELKAREAAITAKEAEFQSSTYIRKDKLTQDPLTALNEAGLSYDQLTELALSQPQDGQVRQILNKMQADFNAKLAALEEKQTKFSEANEQNQTRAYQQAVNQIKTEASKLVYTDPNFETIKETNSVGDVVELIERTFKEDGVLMSVEEAATAVEEHLVEEAMKLTKLKKIQSRLQPKQEQAPAGAAPTQAVEASSPKQPQKTLNNTMNANRPLSAKERAMLAFKGELKKD